MAGLRERIAGQRSGRRRPKPPLPATLRLDRHRGPGRDRWRQTFRNGLGPKASAVRQVFSIPVPGPFSDNTTQRCRLIRPLEKESNLRQSDYKSDALTKLSYPWCRQQDSNLRPPDLNPALSQTELHPRSQSPKRRRIQGGNAACTGGDESSNRCAHFGSRDRERGYRACDGLSQAALSRPIRGFFQQWYFGNTRIQCWRREPLRQKVTRPSTRRPSPCGSTTTASPSRGEMPVSATMSSRWVTMTRLSEPE